jgi:hypothetical protein
MKRCIMLAVLCCALQALFGEEPLSPPGQEGDYGDFKDLFMTPDFSTPMDGGEVPGVIPKTVPVKAIPQWLKDLRRAEIVAFGSVPFTIFFSSFFMDLYRSGTHGWDQQYMPWPFKSAGAVAMTSGELKTMFAIAISGSLVLATVDHFIMRGKRARQAGKNANGP